MAWFSVTRAIKAEAALAFHLVVRHRAPRVAVALGLGLALIAVGRAGSPSPTEAARQLALVVGVLMATAASRPLARGAACASVTRSGARPVLVVVGRLAGAWLAVAWLTAVVAGGLFSAFDRDTARALAAAAAFGTAVGALVLGLAPSVGASAAAAAGIVLTVGGATSPSELQHLFVVGPVGESIRWLLLVLPTGWRSAEWFAEGGAGYLPLLAWWTLAGAAAAAAGVRRRGFEER